MTASTVQTFSCVVCVVDPQFRMGAMHVTRSGWAGPRWEFLTLLSAEAMESEVAAYPTATEAPAFAVCRAISSPTRSALA